MVKQMPKVEAAKQPTIAIITSQYCWSLACLSCWRVPTVEAKNSIYDTV